MANRFDLLHRSWTGMVLFVCNDGKDNQKLEKREEVKQNNLKYRKMDYQKCVI
jgi:hypothetical protein